MINHIVLEKKATWERAYGETFEFHVFKDQEIGDWCMYCSSTESPRSFLVAAHVDFWEALREVREVR